MKKAGRRPEGLNCPCFSRVDWAPQVLFIKNNFLRVAKARSDLYLPKVPLGVRTPRLEYIIYPPDRYSQTASSL